MRSGVLLLAAAVAALASPAWAWEDQGHRIIGRVAVQSLPAEIPAFLRTPLAAQQIGELSREPDRSKGAGQPHDADLNPGHFLDVDDHGRVLGGPLLTALPPTREAFESALRAVGSDQWKAGFLPYRIIDGYQQLVKDFAYWRADDIGARRAPLPQDRAWFAQDRALRELITIRDLGYWSHLVGDGSQPLHVTMHFNGWGEFPNPNGYTTDRIHSPFEGAFVHDSVREEAVRAALPPPAVSREPIGQETERYLSAAYAKVIPLYELWKRGGFRWRDPRGAAFVTERLAAGAAEVRDLVVQAWRDSEDATVGYPAVKVRDIEAGRPVPIGNLYGFD